MKVAAIVFTVLSLILCIFGALGLLIYSGMVEVLRDMIVSDPSLSEYPPDMVEAAVTMIQAFLVITGIIFIVCAVVDIIALVKVSKAKSRQGLTAIGIVTLICMNLVGGILILCSNDSNYQ